MTAQCGPKAGYAKRRRRCCECVKPEGGRGVGNGASRCLPLDATAKVPPPPPLGTFDAVERKGRAQSNGERKALTTLPLSEREITATTTPASR